MQSPIVLFRRPKFYLLLFIIVVVAIRIWPEKVPPQTLNYYRSLLCAVVSGPEKVTVNDFTSVLSRTVESSNSDYSLKKYHYNSTAGDTVVRQWKTLSPEQQTEASRDDHRCIELLHLSS